MSNALPRALAHPAAAAALTPALLVVAVLAAGVVYGTDAFFALVGRATAAAGVARSRATTAARRAWSRSNSLGRAMRAAAASVGPVLDRRVKNGPPEVRAAARRAAHRRAE